MNSAVPKNAPGSRAELVVIHEAELEELARFIASQSGGEPSQVDARLRWFLLENPAREPGAPLGHGLRAPSGELVGCILCVPQAFRFQQETFVLMGSSSFYVNERYRGSGGLIFLKYAELGRRWALFGTSANADAARLWKARGAVPIPDSDHELFGVVNWGPVVEEILARKTGQRNLSRLAGRGISRVVAPFARLRIKCDGSEKLSPLESPEDVTALPIPEASPSMTADRNLRYLRWRYFSGRDSTSAVFAFGSKGLDRDVVVAVNQRPRGYRGQINTLNLLDVYPSVTPEIGVRVVGALLDRYRNSIDAIVLRGQDVERQQLFCHFGFKPRQFEAPNGWVLDRFDRLPTRNWHFVPGDGDWLS